MIQQHPARVVFELLPEAGIMTHKNGKIALCDGNVGVQRLGFPERSGAKPNPLNRLFSRR